MIHAKKIGTEIKIYRNLPTEYFIGRTKINLRNASIEIQQSEGFYEVTEAIIGNYQELIPLVETDLINNKYVQRVRDFSQSEIDAKDELDAENLVTNQLEKELQDGIKASMGLKVYLQRNLTVAQFKNARILVRPVFEALRVGDWDIALDEITIIDNANSTAISQKIKTKIETYINS